MIDWSDPVARLRLIESVGIDEYNRRMEEHLRASVVATAGGREIRRIVSQRWGVLYNVADLNVAFRTVEEAVAEAEARAPHCEDHKHFEYDCIDCADALAAVRQAARPA